MLPASAYRPHVAGNAAATRLSRLHSHLKGGRDPHSSSLLSARCATKTQRKLRVGVVGLGSRGTGTLRVIERSAILQSKIEVIGLADIEPSALQPHAGKGYTLFGTASEMIQSGLIDTLLIITPHYYHTTIGVEAFKAGLHVLTEKPISVHKADAEKLIAACAHLMQALMKRQLILDTDTLCRLTDGSSRADEARPCKTQKFAAMFNNRNNPTYTTCTSSLRPCSACSAFPRYSQ